MMVNNALQCQNRVASRDGRQNPEILFQFASGTVCYSHPTGDGSLREKSGYHPQVSRNLFRDPSRENKPILLMKF